MSGQAYPECSVCSDTYQDPVTLFCTHSFCFKCLGKFWKENKPKNCPICKRRYSKDKIINFPLKQPADSRDNVQKTECSLCSETFRDPVALSCQHRFCFKCLGKFWKENETNNCPMCKKRASSKEDVGIDFHLKQPADSCVYVQKTVSSQVLCKLHPEGPKLFCEDEQRVLCQLCDIPHDRGHILLRVDQAVKNLKEQMNSDLQVLKGQRARFKEEEQSYKQVKDHSEKQMENSEKQIKAEFEMIQRFLREEEQAKLKALREEGVYKRKIVNRKMKSIEEQISSLSEKISAIERDLGKPDVSFLCSYKNTLTSARVEAIYEAPEGMYSRSPDTPIVSGVLIDVASHLGSLGFRVWEKMKDIVKFTPFSLDPNTANSHLYLSEDLSRVRWSDTKQQLPDNPERNSYSATVLGSKGFTTGVHSWEVQVGDHPDWTIGVADTSVDRKGRIYATPNFGIWCLTLRDGEYDNGCGVVIPVQRHPEKIRVQLDYGSGQVSFHDSQDMTHIYTHKHTFTECEKLFPYFAVGRAVDSKTTDIRVCPQGSRRGLESCYEEALSPMEAPQPPPQRPPQRMTQRMTQRPPQRQASALADDQLYTSL